MAAHHSFKHVTGCLFTIGTGLQASNDFIAWRQALNPKRGKYVANGLLLHGLF